MVLRKRQWLLNLLIGITFVVCLLAFTAHSRNWTRMQADRMQLLSGFYYTELWYSDLDSVLWTERIPQMERRHGFSFWAREKGVFTDSLNPGPPAYVFVDDLRQHKIKIRYRDSLALFLNFSDSLETQTVYELLLGKLNGTSEQDVP